MAERKDGGKLDQGLVKALSHPLRIQILQELEIEQSSPARISERFDTSLGTVAYHFRVLLECGRVELVEQRPARGAVEHIYRLSPQASIPSRSWQKVPPSLRSDLVAADLEGFTNHAIAALAAGSFGERQGSAISWSPVTVDERGWGELVKVLKRAEEQFQTVARQGSERLDDPATEGISVVVAVAAFEAFGDKKKD
jgi:DNA-binding transcriptional ArsR family regulator